MRAKTQRHKRSMRSRLSPNRSRPGGPWFGKREPGDARRSADQPLMTGLGNDDEIVSARWVTASPPRQPRRHSRVDVRDHPVVPNRRTRDMRRQSRPASGRTIDVWSAGGATRRFRPGGVGVRSRPHDQLKAARSSSALRSASDGARWSYLGHGGLETPGSAAIPRRPSVKRRDPDPKPSLLCGLTRQTG